MDLIGVPIKGLYKAGDQFNVTRYYGDVEVVFHYEVVGISPWEAMTYECRMLSMCTSRRRDR